MRSHGWGWAAILGVTQIAAAAPSSESVQMARVARDRFYNCTQSLVADYDDRMSPVTIVAKALAAKCQPSAINWVNAMLRYMDRKEVTDLYGEIMRGEEGNLVGIVLQHRVLKARPPVMNDKGAKSAKGQTAVRPLP